MNARTKNLLLAISGMLVVSALFLRGPAAADRSLRKVASDPGGSPTWITSSAAPTPATSPPPVGRDVPTYAVDISTLSGFPPDAEPGDLFDIWVAWDRRIVKGPNIQLLLEGVELERIAPPVTAQGPYVALFIVTRGQARDLLYGERYGALSVTGAVS